MTIYVGDTEGDDLYDGITKFHCLVFKILNENQFYAFCDETQLSKEERSQFGDNIKFFPLDLYKKFLRSEKTTGIIMHNIFGFDLPVIEKLGGIKFDHASIDGRPVEIIDTLVWSRYLNPERRLPKGCPVSVLNIETGKKDKIGPHSLAAWGYKVGVAKPTVNDWRTQPLHIYLHRCIEDVKINEALYTYLKREEVDKPAIANGDVQGDWIKPLKMCQRVYHLMCLQERTGVLFDIKKAESLIVQIDTEMSEIEDFVEPSLGERELPSGKQPNVPTSIWKKPFDYEKAWTTTGKLRKPVKDYLILLGYTDEKAQERFIKGMYCKDDYDDIVNNIEDMLPKHPDYLSTSAINYCAKFEIIKPEKVIEEFKRLEKGGTPKVLVERLKLSHKKDVKEFLVKDGWIPTIWKYRNIIVDKATKQNLSDDEVEVKYQKYIKEFYNSVYWPFILEDLSYSNKRPVDIDTESFKRRLLKKGRGLMSSPQYTDQRGVSCPNLKKLYGETSKKIIRWLSLQNRRATIKSFTKDTGWLNDPRLKRDGRLGARASGVTPTSRQKHAGVVNVPKPKDHVVLGKEMRGLFISPTIMWLVGCDASGIEQRVGGHYAYFFDGGVYARDLLEGDAHTKNAIAYTKAVQESVQPGDPRYDIVSVMEINRDDGKNLTYAIMYGASGKKIAVMASVDAGTGQKLIDAFWDANEGLKKAKEHLEQYWEATGKKYIMGIDGRKIFTRSKHSLLNSLFQSTGAIIMDFAGCWADEMIKREGLTGERVLYVHDEYQWYHQKNEVDVMYIKDLTPKGADKKDRIEPDQHSGGKQWSAPVLNDEGVWVQYYSRIGELIAKGMEKAGKYYKMNLPFPGEYKVGKNWAECH